MRGDGIGWERRGEERKPFEEAREGEMSHTGDAGTLVPFSVPVEFGGRTESAIPGIEKSRN